MNLSKNAKIGIGVGALVLIIIIALFVVGRQSSIERQKTSDSRRQEVQASVEDSANFYEFSGGSTTESTVSETILSGDELKNNILKEETEQSTTESSEEVLEEVKPSDEVLKELSKETIPWKDLYFRKGEVLYVFNHILKIPYEKVDLNEGSIMFYFTPEEFKNVDAMVKEYNVTVARLYSRSSFLQTSTLFSVHYINEDATDKQLMHGEGVKKYASNEILK